MKRHFTIASFSIFIGLIISSILPLPTLAATVSLATSPLATSTTTAVKPNLLFVLDNSGSMSWTFLPDRATQFQNEYGYHTSHCNAIYYNPATTYLPPVDSANVAYPNASFTAAPDGGFDSTSPTRNLNTAFIANRFEPEVANTNYAGSGSYTNNSLGPYGAFYYTYEGTVTDQNYDAGTPFFTECSTSMNTASTLFNKRRLATTETTPLTIISSVNSPAPTATIVVSGTSSTSVSLITVNGTTITSTGSTTASTVASTVASRIAAKITLNGYSASVSGSTVTITGPSGAFDFQPVISQSGSMTLAKTAFTTTTVNSITVNGVQLMSGPALTSSTTSTTASNIASKITQSGYSASVSGSTITVTGPTSATNYAPVLSGTNAITYSTDVFPDITPANLTNFANWYSYYRTRMLMMKSSAGRAFSTLDASYRVGLMKINPSTTPVVEVGPFETTKRAEWYNTFYSITPNDSTPLREALSSAGRYYAGQLSSTDPMQYSCQQNFTILSTDGYWNGNAGSMIDGSTDVGNQDGAAARPFYDGEVLTNQWTFTYTRNSYSKVRDTCGSGNRKLQTQSQIGSCTRSVSTGSCTPGSWTNNGSATLGTVCNGTAAPSPSTPVIDSIVQDTTGGTSDTLADVAMYYYQTDLRTTGLNNCGTIVSPATVGPLCENNVFISPTDNNTQQHMTTFTLGLGGSGKMKYSNSYLNDSTGDYVSVKLGSVARPAATPRVCSWQVDGTTCNWPIPSDGAVENIDDMWHAAVNGRGAYFSATDPTSLADGLSSALSSVNARKGSAAAAATSSLNPVAGNNAAYFASYTTVDWRGNLESRGINTDTGVISENASWSVEDIVAGSCPTTPVAQTTGDTTIYNCETPSTLVCNGGVLGYSGNNTSGSTYCKVQVPIARTGTMNALVSSTTDTRTIVTPNSTGTLLINFDNAYALANANYFNGTRITALSQWSSLTGAQQTLAADPTNMVKFLRGQYGFEDRTANDGPPDNKLYRYRQSVLGDALESQPTFVSKAVFNYPYSGYTAFKTAQASRAGTVYLGSNDGMLHAFAADTGVERWAYIPSMVIPNMWKLADKNYATLHQNYVNGSPITSDVCTANCTDATNAVWKTILVGGLGGGGRGFYALDITTPSTPLLLWEFTPTTGIGSITDDDVGFSYGNPIITRKADGTWVVVVSSGYNNVSPGNGRGYLYTLNAATGNIVSKISTGVGDTTTPSGLAKVAGFNVEPAGNAVGYIYGGDLLGNVWKFNINDTATASIGFGNVTKLASLFSDTAGNSPQPITSTPVLGKISGKRIIFVGTGKYLETGDLTTTQKQTQYAIKDDDSSTLVNPRNTLVQQTLTNNTDGTATRLATSNVVNFYTGRGWYVDFPESGERVNIDSTLVQGALLVPTIVPSNTACSPGGHSWLNFLDYKTGGALGGTTLASIKYDATIVGGNVLFIDGNPVYIPITSDGKIQTPPDLPIPKAAANFTGKRTLWRELMQ